MKALIPGNNRKVKIFLASPTDVPEERDIILPALVDDIQGMLKDKIPVDVELVRWETHSYPGVGLDPQDVINYEIGEYDVFLGLMWSRFGTPTMHAGSGTYEEFKRAYENYRKYNRPHVMFYFRKSPFYVDTLEEWEQFRKVLQFKEELRNLGVFYWEYNLPKDFGRDIKTHLINVIHTLYFPSVLLSYVHEDRKAAEMIYDDLKLANVNVSLAQEDILFNEDFEHIIKRKVLNSQYLLAILSNNSIDERGNAQGELADALDILYKIKNRHKIYIIPIRLNECKHPNEMLNNLLSVDMFPDWQQGLSKIFSALQIESFYPTGVGSGRVPSRTEPYHLKKVEVIKHKLNKFSVLYSPIERAREVEMQVTEDDPVGQRRRRLYYSSWSTKKINKMSRVTNYYGGSACADIVGCNLNCVYCWVQGSNKGSNHNWFFLNPEEVVKELLWIADINHLNIIRLSGGEPTISKNHLIEILDILKQRQFGDTGKKFILETNGILIGEDPSYAKDLKKYRDFLHVRISLKGATPDKFAINTGASPEFFEFQKKALFNCLINEIDCHPAIMLDLIDTGDDLEHLTESLREIGWDKQLEFERLLLYPHVLERFNARGIAYEGGDRL